MGKSNEGTGSTIWLDPNKTAPYDLYQYFLNVGDQEVEDCLRKLTFITTEEITQDILPRHNRN